MSAGRVLVAEDDAALARIVESLLRGAGFEVEVAPDGAAALARYEAAVERATRPTSCSATCRCRGSTASSCSIACARSTPSSRSC